MADPRQTLQDLIRRFGTSLSEDPQRCKGMLRDLCGSSKREIAGLVAAIEEKIPAELLKGHPILVSLRANMIQRLEDHRGLAPELAVWTVDTWGLVLGTWTQKDLDGFSPLPSQRQSSAAQATAPRPATQPRPEPVIDLTSVPVEPPPLDRAQDLPLTATERQAGVKKPIVLESGKRLEVNLPAGVQVGQRLRLQGHGERDPVTGAVGDVYLVVQDKQEPAQVVSTPVSSLGNKTFNLPNNGGQLELIAVPGGTLVMKDKDGRGTQEHRVNLQPFLIGKYPVTQRQYQAVIGKNPSRFKGNLECPVERVSWHDAIVFCQELSKILNQTIDLPSETQWEWAARGATKSKGFEYAGSNNLDEVGWYGYEKSGKATHPVGQKKPNELGLYDMSGNVWEWCKDNWTENVTGLPVDGSPLTKGDDSYRLLRGGSWDLNAKTCRSAYRYRNAPDYRDGSFGFRVVCRASRTL